MSKELAYLKDNLMGGKILKIEDPRKFTTEQILKSYFREILMLARKYSRPTVDYEDLVVEGLMGLLDAVERWDPEKSKGNPRSFHNLAIVRIKSHMFEYFLANNTMYTIPNYMGRAMALVDQIRNLVHYYEYPGDPRQALLNFEDPVFEEHVPADFAQKVRKLKEKVQSLASSSERTYEEMIQNVLRVEEEIENFERSGDEFEVDPETITSDREFLSKFLRNLNPSARSIIESLMEGDTLEQAGEKLGLTRERARQIKKETLDYFEKTKMFQDATGKPH